MTGWGPYSVEVTDEELKAKPGLKLMEFLQGMVKLCDSQPVPFETTRMEATSNTMRELPAISVEMMDLYLTQWGL